MSAQIAVLPIVSNTPVLIKERLAIAKVYEIDIPSSTRFRSGTICHNCRSSFVYDDREHPYADLQTFGYEIFDYRYRTHIEVLGVPCRSCADRPLVE